MLLPLDAALLALPALALAAGVDLYLTLLVLGVAPALGLWPDLPGALDDLSAPGVLLVTGLFYLGELAADRDFTASLVWNALHAIIRPLAGALLALLVLDGEPAWLQATGALASAALASGAHATATGGFLLLLLDRRPRAHPLLVSIAEDVAVLGMVVLALDRPDWAALTAGALTAGALPLAGSQLRAFAFSVRLAVGRVRGILTGGAWTRPEDFPEWLQKALATEATAPGGLRGTPGAGLRLPGCPRLVLGWVVVRGETPLFVHARGPRGRLDLGDLPPHDLTDEGFLRTVELPSPDGAAEGDPSSQGPQLLLPRDGPSAQTLRSEFLLD